MSDTDLNRPPFVLVVLLVTAGLLIHIIKIIIKIIIVNSRETMS